MADTISVEVACATPDKQFLEQVELNKPATVAEAIVASGVREAFPELNFDELKIGVWSKPLAPATQLRDGDRVEVYRPLEMDPREARRKIADSGGVMGISGSGR